MRHLLHRGTDRLYEIMELPFVDADGRTNTAAIAQFLKVFQMIDLRVKGAVTQRVQIEQKSLNVNTTVMSDDNAGRLLESLDMSELETLEKKLNRIERNKGALLDQLPAPDRALYDVKQSEFKRPTRAESREPTSEPEMIELIDE